jgi:hypothetical protein
VLGWALSTFGADIIWAVEVVRAVSRLLEQDLLDAGQKVVRSSIAWKV